MGMHSIGTAFCDLRGHQIIGREVSCSCVPLLSEAVVWSGTGCKVVLCMLRIASPKIPCAAV